MSEALTMFATVPLEDQAALQALASKYEAAHAQYRRAASAQIAAGDAQVVGIDWTSLGSLLVKVLPPLLAALKGGSPVAVVLSLLDFVLPLLLPNQALVDLAKQIITLILKPFST